MTRHRVVALVSGGKDSCYSMMQCVAAGHDVVALANLRPLDCSVNELDSYMYQTVGYEAIELYAEAMRLPLFRGTLRKGGSVNTGETYTKTENDEVEDLFELLKRIREEKGEDFFSAVCSGAILSNYQRVRVEHVCARLNLISFSFLWRRDQSELLDEMVENKLNSVIVKVAALGLNQSHLNMSIAELRGHLRKLNSKYGINVCGEGGEYETFTLDCPLFYKEIVLEDTDTFFHSDDAFSPVVLLKVKRASLKDKFDNGKTFSCQSEMLASQGIRTSTPLDHCEDVLTESSLCPAGSANGKAGPLQNVSQGFSCHFGSGFFFISNLTSQCDDPVAATREVMENLKGVLADNELTTSSVASVALLLSDMEHYQSVNGEYVKHFGVNPPVRVCFESPIETMLSLSVVGHHSKTKEDSRRKTMHVQSISHWAPANIGPYSQAVKVDDVLFTAGQIGMIPGTLQLAEGPRNQATISMRHLRRVLDVFGATVADSKAAVCYMSEDFSDIAQDTWTSELRSGSRKNEDDCVGGSKLLLCVIVPRLPKDALVEWNVVAGAPGESGCDDEEAGRWGVDRLSLDGVTAVVEHSIDSRGRFYFKTEFTGDELQPGAFSEWRGHILEASKLKLSGGDESSAGAKIAIVCKFFAPPGPSFAAFKNCPSPPPFVFSHVPISRFACDHVKAAIVGFANFEH